MESSGCLVATVTQSGEETKLAGGQKAENLQLYNTWLSKKAWELEKKLFWIFRSACAIPDERNDQVYITGGDRENLVRYEKLHILFMI